MQGNAYTTTLLLAPGFGHARSPKQVPESLPLSQIPQAESLNPHFLGIDGNKYKGYVYFNAQKASLG